MMGFHNYIRWVEDEKKKMEEADTNRSEEGILNWLLYGGKKHVPGKVITFLPGDGSRAKREHLRDGPEIDYENVPFPGN
jgi:hypothetical protein